MGIKKLITRAGVKAADKVAKLAVLSPDQLKQVEENREKYLMQMPKVDGDEVEELTSRLIAASSTEVFNLYLNQLGEYYDPVEKDYEFETDFNPANNIRYFNITKWVTDRKENNIEKLVNVYEVLSNEECNIALVFNRKVKKTNVYLAVVDTKNSNDNVDVENYKERIKNAINGNFPGSDIKNEGVGILPCLDNSYPYSVACASNIPAEKSEKFISQTIEKLLDGIIPKNSSKEYTIILLATPVTDIENRKIHLAELYSGLAPYAGWDTNYTFTESDSTNSNATFGVNLGASAGIQHGQNQANTKSHGETDNSSTTETESESEANTKGDSTSETNSEGDVVTDTEGDTETISNADTQGGSSSDTTSDTKTHTTGDNTFQSKSNQNDADRNVIARTWHSIKYGIIGDDNGVTSGINKGSGKSTSDALAKATSHTDADSWSNTTTESLAKNVAKSVAKSTTKSVAKTASKSVTNTVGKSVANTLGKAVSNTVSSTAGRYKGVNLGTNVGANFARSSNVTATVGKNEGIVQHFTNYNIKHLLENLEMQMKRYEQSVALGMWDFAAYFLSEDQNVANNVAYTYMALTQGEKSYMTQGAVNLWRGDMGEKSKDAKEIFSYIRELRHPVFALDPELTKEIPICNVYPAIVTPTVSLSGKELAYSLNFPQKSISGLPVINCTEFGREVISYDSANTKNEIINIGNVFHMNKEEKTYVDISLNSLASHTFITGSTGSGKSNTVYKIIEGVLEKNKKFLVIEPAKGEYKNVFGNDSDVSVYGTNPYLSKLLRINPFSFPDKTHIYEHMDRLVEIFNVCWPMYAAMPAVLKDAIEKSYVDCGWNLIESENKYGKKYYPTFSDVARNIKIIIDSSEYDTENKGAYKGSLLTRLQSLANGINGLIFSSDEIPSEDLFEQNVIVDLSRVGSSETKSLIMGMLILKLQEYRMSSAKQINEPLKHITILEEAHNILKKTSTEQPVEGGNLIGKSVEMISNAIAEMRTYGEGFVIVDQAPGLLDMSAIRNTNTKIIMRLPDQSDRELVGKAANLNEEQIKELAKLPCGVSAVYQNEWINPVLCKVGLVDSKNKIYKYEKEKIANNSPSIEERLEIAEMLSKGLTIGKEIDKDQVIKKLESMKLSDYTIVSIIGLMTNPPRDPNMVKLAPVINALLPEITDMIRDSYLKESDVTEWTREANENLMKYKLDDQVRRDIIQSSITYYLLNMTNNRSSLERWIENGGLR
ncbi:MAG: DUF87 domain-containing protein [Eubacterium sp.]|nr:DUF87 domain-containing protein [Eubacterium sp.]